MTGHAVLHAMCFDASSLPAEQYAALAGTHPRKATEDNVTRDRAHLRHLGLAGSTGQRRFGAWARSHPMVAIAGSVEYPDAAARGLAPGSDTAQDFGRRIAAALEQVFD